MSRRFPLGLIMTLIAFVLALSCLQAVAVSEKIAPRVLSDTSNGASTEALVVMSVQADLSHASTLPTKLEKGRFVVNALRSVADHTQGPIMAFLQQRGVPYQAFY